MATDIAATMLTHVRRNAAAAGLGQVRTVEAAADEIPARVEPEDIPLDGAICRMALMHFPDPVGALATVRRVMRPGARIAALVFSTPSANLMMAEPMAILRRHADLPAPPPGTPGIFALGAGGVLDGVLAAAGLTGIEVRRVPVGLRFTDGDAALAMLREAAGAYRAVAATMDEATRAAAWAEVRDALARWESKEGFCAPLEVIVGAGAA